MGVAEVPRASGGGRLRLTRRGRVVVTLLLLLLVAAAAAVFSPASRAADPGRDAPAGPVVGGSVGAPGDSRGGAAATVVVPSGDRL